MAAIICGRGRAVERPNADYSNAAEAWSLDCTLLGSGRRRIKRQSRSPTQPRLKPQRKRRKRPTVNRMGLQNIQRQDTGHHETPERPEHWRARKIRIAWQTQDYMTLYQLGEIPAVPEFD